jgi:hypothetical protein
MEDGHDRRFLHQDLLRFLIQLYPIPLVQAALGLLYQAIVTLIPPPTLLLNMIDSRPQKIVRIGIVGHPAHDKEMRHVFTQPGKDRLPLYCLPIDLDFQIFLPLGL